jgi:hypothetical protein
LQYPLSHRHQPLRKKKLNQPLQRLSKASQLKLTLKKPSLLRSNPTRFIVLSLEDSEFEVVLDDAVHRGYPRPRIIDEDSDEVLPERIRWRLFLARQLALLKYKEAHG